MERSGGGGERVAERAVSGGGERRESVEMQVQENRVHVLGIWLESNSKPTKGLDLS